MKIKNRVLVIVAALCPVMGWGMDDRWCHPLAPVTLEATDELAGQLIHEGEHFVENGLKVTGLLNPVPGRADRGRLNSGVYRLPLIISDRPQIMKIAQTRAFTFKSERGDYLDFTGYLWGASTHRVDRSSRRFREYLMIHQRLGELGVTPRLHGVLDAGNLQNLLLSDHSGLLDLADQGKFDLDELESGKAVGLIMDEVLDGRALSRDTAPPEFLAVWTEAHMQRALDEINEMRIRLSANGIVPQDQQLVITRDGHVWLIDVDGAYYDPAMALSINFEAESHRLVDQWQKVNGRLLNANIKSSISRKQRVLVEHQIPITDWSQPYLPPAKMNFRFPCESHLTSGVSPAGNTAPIPPTPKHN